MLTKTGAYFAEQRRAKHFNPHTLAAALGYSNVAKGANRILALEREGNAPDGLLDNITNVLGLDREHIQELLTEDRRRVEKNWQRWANEPVEPRLRFRPFAGLWCGESLPEHLTREQALDFARTRATERHLTYVLVWSRKEEIWCYAEGDTRVSLMNVGDVAGPVTTLRGRGGSHGFSFG
jgi:hypothetical protein